MSHVVYAQEWEESERGWGIRPDGFYLFLTKEAAKSGTEEQVKAIREREAQIYKGAVPDEYSRPCGNPRLIEVSDKVYSDIVASETGCVYARHLSEVEYHHQRDKTVKKTAKTNKPSLSNMTKDELVKLITSATKELSKRS